MKYKFEKEIWSGIAKVNSQAGYSYYDLKREKKDNGTCISSGQRVLIKHQLKKKYVLGIIYYVEKKEVPYVTTI
jgi:hypothetical protein